MQQQACSSVCNVHNQISVSLHPDMKECIQVLLCNCYDLLHLTVGISAEQLSSG
jgi:hypothetical protein